MDPTPTVPPTTTVWVDRVDALEPLWPFISTWGPVYLAGVLFTLFILRTLDRVADKQGKEKLETPGIVFFSVVWPLTVLIGFFYGLWRLAVALRLNPVPIVVFIYRAIWVWPVEKLSDLILVKEKEKNARKSGTTDGV